MYTNDSQVISAVLQGDKDRYEELIQKYKRMVYCIAWSHLGNSDLSEDAAQETFVKAYSYLGTLRNPDRFSGWLARIARNVCNSFGRKAKRERALMEQWSLESTSQPREDDRESLDEQLRQSFAALPAIHREALTVFYIEDKSLRESAAVLGISETALKTRLFRARTALRQQLERRLEDTLESLEPSKDFNRLVLAMLPLSPKGAAGAGGLLALLGKLSAAFSFFFWLALGPALTSGIFYLHFRADAANIKDKPENRHIKANIMRNASIVIVSMAGAMLLMSLIMFSFDLHSIFKVMAALQILATYRMGRRLRVNASPFMIGDVLGWVAMTLSSLAIGFLGAPIETFFLLVIPMSILGYFTHNSRQPRVDAHLLLGATGDLSREQLKALAKFLGGYGFVMDYYFEGDTLALVIPEIRPSFAAQFTKRLSSGSRVFVRPDGSCEAYYSDSDLNSAQEVHNMPIDRESSERGLCGTVQHVLESLRRNDLQAATSILAPPLNQNVYKRDPQKLRHWHVQYILSSLLIIGFLTWTRMETGHWFHYIPSENWFDLIKGK